MNYLVTGGAGFIGSHIAAHLCSKGNVRVLDNFSTGKLENLANLDVDIVDGDFCDRGVIRDALDGIDVVFHEGALCSVSRSIDDPVATHDVNATGTLTVLEACRHAGVKRIVMASSSSVYGNAPTLPKSEEMQPSPLSPYAISKLVSEHYCQVYFRCFGLETVALRYFNVFGPRQDPGSEYAAVIPKFMSAIQAGKPPVIFGDGTQSRDFTYVENVVRANILAAETKAAAGEVFNVGCGERYSLLDLISHMEKLFGTMITPIMDDPRPGDVAHSLASTDKAKSILGYEPVVGFNEGLHRTAEWFLGVPDSAPTPAVARASR